MPDFICDECDAIENTALGFYWGRNRKADEQNSLWKDSSLNGKALCSECTPSEYRDGSKKTNGGIWHGKFPKVIATEEIVLGYKDGTRDIGFGRLIYLGRFSYLLEDRETKESAS